MIERKPTPECAKCPNRSGFSRTLAKALGKNTVTPACTGPTTVGHGVIETQVRQGNEPAPDKANFDWNRMVGGGAAGGERRYSRTTWTSETICGKEAIEPRPGEVLYDLRQPTQTKADGSLVAAFILGDEQQIEDLRNEQAFATLLDATSDMQIAESSGDVTGVADAQNRIAAQGFTLGATAGRHDGKQHS